jgi:hypothetical protein
MVVEVAMRRLVLIVGLAGVVAACSGSGADDASPSAPTPTDIVSSAPTTTHSAPPSTVATPVTALPTSPATAPSPTVLPDTSVGDGVVTLVADGVSEMWLAAVVDADDRPVVAYSDDGVVRLLRCDDPTCETGVRTRDLGYSGFDEPLVFDLALHADGSPVVIVQSWDAEYDTIHTCLDPTCSDVTQDGAPFVVSEFGHEEPCLYPDGTPCPVDFPSLSVGSDDLVRVMYFRPGLPGTVMLATCVDHECGLPAERVELAEFEGAYGADATSLFVDEDDRLVFGYSWDRDYDDTGLEVAVCADPSCTSGPETVLELTDSVVPRITDDPGDGFHVWYRTGAPGLPPEFATQEVMEGGPSAAAVAYSDYADAFVVQCDPSGCGEPQYVPVGEDWLLPFSTFLEVFTFADGMPGAFFHAASLDEPVPQLHVTRCDDDMCTSGTTEALGVAIDERSHRFVALDGSPGTPPRAVFVANGGLFMYTCADDTCTSP